ncbi:hypothetical protein [Streptomyces sp. S1D4-20]|uniref:hypothetical protein n=1 Tax=Streptomyces sp. S1D4-20 TaxID=2594462 RepID=UPI0011653C20|nr:hypothetical protein [Streptomyces sp. S1D4-20]QDN54153.1 hypothetical protein FNV67_00835 [Streptomyces sp. S1D4-20]
MTETAVHEYEAVNPGAVDADRVYFTTAEPTGVVIIAIIDRRPVGIRVGTCSCPDHPQYGPRITTVILDSRP